MADNSASLGTMLSFLQQGADAGQDQTQAVGIPKMDMPALPQRGGGGGGLGSFVSGTLKGILGNMASQYVSHKMNQQFEKSEAKDLGDTLNESIRAQHANFPANSPFHAALESAYKLPSTGPGVRLKTAYMDNINAANSGNLALTSAQKELNDPRIAEQKTRNENFGPIPAGMFRNPDGSLQSSQVVGGGNYEDTLRARSAEQKNIITPMQQKQLELSQQSNARANEAVVRLDAKDARDEARYQKSLIKEIPANHRTAYVGNMSSIKQIDEALKLATERPQSFGLDMLGGDFVNQRLDPEGTKARGAVAAIGSVKRHDMSGAAVSPTEDKNLKPFIPNETDSAETVVTKLQGLRSALVGINNDIGGMYKSGYREGLPTIPKDPITMANERKAADDEDRAATNLDDTQEAAYQAFLKSRGK